MRDKKKTLRWKIICLNEVYELSLGYYLTRCILYVLISENSIENQKFHFLTKICEIQNKRWKNKNLFVSEWYQ